MLSNGIIYFAILGFFVGASFGPVNIQLTKQGLIHGIKNALSFAFGAAFADAVLFLFWFSGGSLIDKNNITAFSIINLGGGIILIFIAVRSLISFHVRGIQFSPLITCKKLDKNKYGFKGAFLLTLFSPFGILLWAGIAGRVTSYALSNSIPKCLAASVVISGDILWFSIWVTVLNILKRNINLNRIRPIFIVSDFAIMFFGIHGIYRTLKIV